MKTQGQITRDRFTQVIRRAAELSLTDADAGDDLTEDEVVRIGTELGLSAHHVQRALLEVPELAAAPRWYDGYFGSPVFSVSRSVAGDAGNTLRLLEDYLVTREYLQIVRRRPGSLGFAPAEDTISAVARALFRPDRRHRLARASRVLVGVHELADETVHARFEVDLSEARRAALRSGILLGGTGGMVTGALFAGITAGVLPPDFGVVPHVLAFTGGIAAGGAAGFSIAASRFRERLAAAKHEVVVLLDRLEHGARLDPPPAPWRRKLQLRLSGSRPPR